MTIREFYWNARNECRELLLWYICRIPRGIGIYARRRLLPSFLARLGEGTVVQEHFWVTNPEKVSIGSHCNFAQGVFITGGGGVTIGDYVGLGPDVKIWSVNHRFEDPDTPWLKQGWDKLPVVIEDDVWLGANCFVMPGITIGRGAILSAGTIMMKSVPPYAICAGNPGRVVGWRKRPEARAPDSQPTQVAANEE
ncbi:MAG TPA: acyltransferase [Steroidobacteraceae bacterium]|nr:acyltransferase [Steroidobacteraceae bacterium]